MRPLPSNSKLPIIAAFLTLLFTLNVISLASAQTQKQASEIEWQNNSYVQNAWAWIGGEQSGNQQSVYGTQGVASSLNQPGARTFGISWTDSAGVMWLFGGNGIDSTGTTAQLNDLWKYDGQNWTWVGGSQVVNQKGNYGTLSTTSPTNWPGARDNAATWYVDGVLWMFGGFGVDNNNNSGHLNDLWKWDGTNWTWMGNGTTNNQSGIYGTKGTPDFNNLPGSRISTNRWVDSSGNMWMYGGEGYDENGNFGRLNDLWRLESFGRWTWVSGSKTINSIGNFGTKNVTAATNQPSARTAAATWLGENNVFYLFGGFGFDKDGNLNNLNDLWTFDGSNWTWINGSDSVNAAGVYGTFNVTSETNYPGARRWPAYIQVSTNEVYLFGGGGADNSGFTGWLDDLWKWDGQNWTWVRGLSFRNPSPVFGQKFVPNVNNRAPARDASAFWLDADKNLVVFGGYGRTGNTLANLNDLWQYTLQPNNTIILTFTPEGGNTVDVGTQVQITANQQNTTIHYTLDGTTPTSSSAIYTTPISINNTTTIKAIGVNAGFNSSDVTAGIFIVQPTITEYTTAKGQFTWVSGTDSLNLPTSYKNQLALSQLALDPELIKLIEEGSNDIPENVAKELTAASIKANHGTKGIASASNTPGGRNLSLTWTDEDGIFWLFGGLGINPDLTFGRFNDLWSFDGQFWTWVGGSNLSNQAGIYGIKNNPSTANWPGSRSASSMVRNERGDIYLFGGRGFDTNDTLSLLNDLWKWDGQNWTWISGSNTVNQSGIYNTKGTASSTSTPGARETSTLGIFENGDLWVFGGNGYSSGGSVGRLNDLWKWDGSNWTWLAGTNVINSAAVYGTKMVADSLNTPSARDNMRGWTDKNDAIWIFGGGGFDIASKQGVLNDIWKWDGTNWTWMAGENTINAPDNYGIKGQATPTNTPSARNQYSITQDNNGVVWLFGGNSNDGITTFRTNTLWKWDGQNWTWVAGSNAKNQQATFGTKGQPNVANQPRARSSSHISFDAKNNLIWLYGGFGINPDSSVGRLNDIWVFEPDDKDLIKPVTITVNELTSSVSQVILASETPGLSIYYTLDGSTPTSSSSLYSVPFTLSETTIIKAIGIQNNNLSTVLSEKRVVINPVPSTLQTVENQWTWFGGSNTADASGVYKLQGKIMSNILPLAQQGDATLVDHESVQLNTQKGVYGEVGVKDASNIPGARYGAGTWKDSNNNIWLFGGNGVDSEGNTGYLNDLWVYDGNFWTWMGGSKIKDQQIKVGVKGIPSANSWPGGMEIPKLAQDSNGHVYLFGGFTIDNTNSLSRSNLLWKWDGENWTWLSGTVLNNALPNYGIQGVTTSANVLGGRSIPTIWVDEQNNVFVFGGNGFDAAGSAGSLNDLWRWDGANWTWIGGSNQINGMPNYGERGIASSTTWPAAVRGSNVWKDANKDVFIFGGFGVDSTAASGNLNTLWRWDGTNWAWMGGAKTVNPLSVASQLGVRNTTNWPGARYFSSAHIDQNGQVLLLGGRVQTSTYSNEVWSWDGEQWAWINGELNTQVDITYGSLNQPSSTNNPGSRYLFSSWINEANKLVTFAGYHVDPNNTFTRRNDMWAYQQETVIGRSGKAVKPVFSSSSGTFIDSLSVTISTSTPNSIIYYTTDGSVPNLNSSVYSSPIKVRVNTTLTAIARGTTTLNSDTSVAIYTINYSKAEKPTYSPIAGTYQDSVRVTLSTSNPADAIYYTLNGSVPDTTSTRFVTPFLVRTSTKVTAFATRDFAVNSDTSVANYTITYDRVPLPIFTPEAGTYNDSVRVTITTAMPGATIYYTTQAGGLTVNSPIYSSPILVTENTTIRAFATAPFMNSSNIASASYVITNIPAPSKPTISPKNTSFVDSVLVNIAFQHESDSVFYSLDGSNPTKTDSYYSGPFWLNPKNVFSQESLNVQDTIIIKAATYNSVAVKSVIDSSLLAYSITPNSFSIVNPAEGSTISVSSATPDSQVDIQWQASIPHANEIIYYQWMLYADTINNSPILLQNEQAEFTQTSIQLSNSQLLQLLTQNNISTSDSLKLYHRVTATNGSETSKKTAWGTFFLKEQKENAPPDQAIIVSPNNNAFLTLGGNPQSLLTVAWEIPNDPDNDTLSYQWQLSKTELFDPADLVTEVSNIKENFYSLTYKAFSELTDAAGIDVGQQTVLFHRINTSDGQAYVTGRPNLIIFQRNTLTGIEENELPEETTLFQNYPNPFNPTTTINYAIVGTEMVNLSVYAIDGTLIETLVSEVQSTGNYSHTFNAANLPTGVYVYRLQTNRVTSVKKMLLIK